MIHVGGVWQITRSDGFVLQLDIEQFVMPDPEPKDRLSGVASQENPRSSPSDTNKRMGTPILFKLRGEVAQTLLVFRIWDNVPRTATPSIYRGELQSDGRLMGQMTSGRPAQGGNPGARPRVPGTFPFAELRPAQPAQPNGTIRWRSEIAFRDE